MSSHSLVLMARAAALVGAGLRPALAQPKPARLAATGSEIGFTTRQMGVPVDGKFSAQIALEPRLPASGSVTFTIDTSSARFGSAEIDAEVPKAIGLDSKRPPLASFPSTAIKAAGRGRFTKKEGTIVFDRAGQTGPVALKATRFNCYQNPIVKRKACGGDFETTRQRSLSGSTYGLPGIPDKVRLPLQVEAFRQ